MTYIVSINDLHCYANFRRKKRMPVSCCVIGCAKRYRKDCGVSFFRIPDEIPKRTAWINAIKRKNWSPSEHERVCGLHFLTGKTTNDQNDPDFVPHLNMGYDENKTTPTSSLVKSERNARRKRRSDLRESLEASVENNTVQSFEPDIETSTFLAGTPEEAELASCSDSGFYYLSIIAGWLLTILTMSIYISENDSSQKDSWKTESPNAFDKLMDTYLALKKENQMLYEELGKLQQEKRALEKELMQRKFGVGFLNDSANTSKTNFFTGFPNYDTFNWALELCESTLPKSKKLCPGDVFLLICMKLKLNLLNQDLAYRFHISDTAVSRFINSGLPVIAKALAFLVRWPEKEEILRTLPSVFKPTYSNCRVIIDCTEFFCERSRNLTVRALTWSNYKHHNTLKVLVGISPTGAVSFISKAFGGRVSDKMITQKSGFLDLLEHNDLVLADRGFLIDEEVACRGARIAMPSFTKGLKQLSMRSVEQSRRLARVRIHVERMMERLKNFKVLSNVIPLSLVPHIDNITLICAAISNLKPRLIK